MYPFNEIAWQKPMFYCSFAIILLIAILVVFGIFHKKTIADHVVLKRIKAYWTKQFVAATVYTYERERKYFSIFQPNLHAPLAAIQVLIDKVPLQDEESIRMVADAKGILSNTMQRIKNISVNPQPTALDKSKLVDALKNLVEALSGASCLTIYLATDGVSSLSHLQELAIFKNVQKLANNMFKENRASFLNIELKKLNGEMQMMVKDLQKRQPIEMAFGA